MFVLKLSGKQNIFLCLIHESEKARFKIGWFDSALDYSMLNKSLDFIIGWFDSTLDYSMLNMSLDFIIESVQIYSILPHTDKYLSI